MSLTPVFIFAPLLFMMSAPTQPTQLDRDRFTDWELAGRGNYGRVYRAKDSLRPGKHVAIKETLVSDCPSQLSITAEIPRAGTRMSSSN